MAAMTNVAVPAGTAWTLIYTAAGTVTITVQPRVPNGDVWVRVDGSSGATSDDPNSPAMLLRPYDRLSMTLATGDKVYALPQGVYNSRVTVLA